jgi:protein-S-isoprenylcysteine O-methyltransferase Ste14
VRLITLLLKILFPASVAIVVFGTITWQLRRLDAYIPLALPPWLTFVGVAVMAAGAALTFVCFALFAEGGMLTPRTGSFDPNVLVRAGPYEYVRNPMALGALTTLAGWGLVQRSVTILVFALFMTALMHIFVVLVEEPKLERRFGQSYRAYKSRVPRWIPAALSKRGSAT